MDLRKDIYFYADLASFPTSGSKDLLYVDRDTGFIYSWNGASYLSAGTGGLNYLGLWDASTNSPSISSGVGSPGDYYVVGTPGSTSIDGISDWDINDWIIFGSSTWQKIDNSEKPIPTLQQVTDSGNTTDNDIQFDSGVGILLNNSSRLREGSIDAGYGGNKGIAQICGVGYEMKWEAGRLYIMNDGGTQIREVRYTFGYSPSSSDDVTKGFTIGSRWVLDNGDVYVCTDNTSTAAIWELQTIGLNDLNDVDIITVAPSDGEVLTYDSISGLWKNEAPSSTPTPQVVLFADLGTTEALKPCTYNNGTLGVGATLTGNSNGQLSTISFTDRIDNVVTALNQIILVKNQANQTQNGLYLVTQLGSPTQPFILTRATDADTQDELYPLQVNVFGGASLSNVVFLQKTADPVLGTSNIVFTTTAIGITNTPVLHVDTATSAALPSCTYTSGTNPSVPGSGAYLQATVNGALGTINGFTLTNGRRLLVKDQVNQAHNGVYVVSSAGSATSRWRLTRVDASGGNFTMLEREWKVNNPSSTKYGARYSTNLASLSSTAVGTTNIVFYEIISAPASRNITINGITQDLSADRTWSVGTVTSLTTTGTSGAATLIGSTLNIPQYAGGLTEFTEAENTAAPNATVAVNSLTPVTATTNADFAIRPKGTGAIIAAIPDNTVTGGNKRGANALDLSTKRTNAADVASGASSIVIGENARATNANSFAVGLGGSGSISSGGSSVAIGSWTTATGSNSFASGSRVDATALNSVSIGGYNYGATTASGESSFASGGATASGDYSLAIGPGNIASGRHSVATGANSHTFGISGRQAHSAGVEATQGDSQASKFILRERTTGNTATTITTDSNAAASTNNQVILSNQSAYRFKGTIIGKQSGSTNIAAWDVDGLIVRGANAAATTLVVSNVNLVSNTPAWGTPTLAADTTNGGLRVQVIGAATTNIQWTCTIETTEVIYA
jgi:hypothetical protein